MGLVAGELLDTFTRRRWQRQAGYRKAEARARETGKPFVVVGAPRAGWATRIVPTYGCGDLCIDMNGCPSCQVARRVDITDMAEFEDDSAVLFVSCVMEYVLDPAKAAQELQRVAGKDLFVFRLPSWTTAHITWNSHQRILAAPMGDGVALRWKRVPWRR